MTVACDGATRAISSRSWRIAVLSPSSGGGSASRAELANDPPLGHRSLHRQQQVGAIGRLGEIAGRTGLEALARGELVAVAGENDDRDFEPSLLEVLHQPEAVHARHFDVEQGRVRRVGVEGFEGLKGVAASSKLVTCPGQDALSAFRTPGVVIDDKDGAFHGVHGSSVAIGSGLWDLGLMRVHEDTVTASAGPADSATASSH